MGYIKWDTLQSTGVEDSTFLCLVQDCIIMGDFNHGNIKWDTLQSTG